MGKQTDSRHAANKKLQTLLQSNAAFRTMLDDDRHAHQRRLAWSDGIVALSGATGVQFAHDQYEINLADPFLVGAFQSMLTSHGYAQALPRGADACSEAHLWMTLFGLATFSARNGLAPRNRHRHPRHLEIWVFERGRKSDLKEDSPCDNCKQWVRAEFLRLNGV